MYVAFVAETKSLQYLTLKKISIYTAKSIKLKNLLKIRFYFTHIKATLKSRK